MPKDAFFLTGVKGFCWVNNDVVRSMFCRAASRLRLGAAALLRRHGLEDRARAEEEHAECLTAGLPYGPRSLARLRCLSPLRLLDKGTIFAVAVGTAEARTPQAITDADRVASLAFLRGFSNDRRHYTSTVEHYRRLGGATAASWWDAESSETPVVIVADGFAPAKLAAAIRATTTDEGTQCNGHAYRVGSGRGRQVDAAARGVLAAVRAMSSRGQAPGRVGRPELFAVREADSCAMIQAELASADCRLGSAAQRVQGVQLSKPANARQSCATRSFCAALLGQECRFKGGQLAEDLGLLWPAVYNHALAAQSGPGPPAALAEAVPAYAEMCADLPGGVPVPGTVVTDERRQAAANPFLLPLAKAAIALCGSELDAAFAAVLRAGQVPDDLFTALGVASLACPEGLAKLLLGPGGVQTWLCEERKFLKPQPVSYAHPACADAWSADTLASGRCDAALLAVAMGNAALFGVHGTSV